MAYIPGHRWQELKRELMEKWHELSDSELDETRGNVNSIVDLMEKKLGLAFDEASRKMQEMTSHYHLYDEPEEDDEFEIKKPVKERIMELAPKKPSERPDELPPKPRDRSL